ncbi:hypothetical protein IP86_03110 [Rhodopseudomonas sp. AAP120]|nr:hypothetical protein IP86_03110 [Rhodopseudomonas sp. AAP120]
MARGADIDPSTLTRFKSTDGRTISPLTMQQLANRWQFALDPTISGSVDSTSFAAEAQPYRSSGVKTPLDHALDALRAGCIDWTAWTVRARTMEAAGFLPGDVVLVDHNARPSDGDAVLAEIYDFDRSKPDLVWRRLRTSGNIQLLVSASFDPNLGEPALVDGKNVNIKGVVLGHRLRSVNKAA